MNKKVLFLIIALFIVSGIAFSAVPAAPAAQNHFKAEITRGDVLIQTADNKVIFTVPMAFSELVPSARTRNTLGKIFSYLKFFPNVTLEIEGHTDNVKPKLPETIQKYPDLNAYSLGRAEEMKKLLISFGMKAAQITTKGAGDSKPVGSNDDEAGRAKNRRVVITAELGASAAVPAVNPPAAATPPAGAQSAPQSGSQPAPQSNPQPRIEMTPPAPQAGSNNPPQDNAPARNQ